MALQLAAALISCEERPEELGFVCLDDRLSDSARREGFAVLPQGSHDKLFSDTRIKGADMRYMVILDPTNEAARPGWYYARIPSLDLTTHGLGSEGAMEAARDLMSGWIAELRSRGEPVPKEKEFCT